MSNVQQPVTKQSPAAILQRIADAWLIDPDQLNWHAAELEGSQAFSWEPGKFCVNVRSNQHDAFEDAAVRIRIDTDFIRNIDPKSEAALSLLASMGPFFTSTYAWACFPPEIQDTLVDTTLESGTLDKLWLSATAYVRDETAGWLPEFLARMSVLQPINAQIYAAELTKTLGGVPDTTDTARDEDTPFDEILGVLGQVFVPAGQEQSRWSNCDEFLRFAETWGQSDNCFGTGDPTGLTLEAPFGDDTVLVRLFTDQKHPQLGNGLLATLQLPTLSSELKAAKLANELNFMETTTWTGFPLLGCWHSRKVGEAYTAAFSLFIPNALYQPMIATNAAFWMLHRARWVKNSRFEHLVDRPMIEILERRLSTLAP
jgi:hypothetical protein